MFMSFLMVRVIVQLTFTDNLDPIAATWWLRFGEHCPELQNLAVRILSQTCNGAEVYGLRRAIAERLLSSGENVIENRRLQKLAYVHYNLKLKQSKKLAKFSFIDDEIDTLDDWIVDELYKTDTDESERTYCAHPDMHSGSTLNALNKSCPSRVVLPTVDPMLKV